MVEGLNMSVTFHGVRGSTPCHGDTCARYGGNTSCVSVDVPGAPPILLDLGTGLRYFGLGRPTDEPFVGACLLTHLHWDHIQGLPFFTPLLRPGARLDVYAPAQDDGRSVREVMDASINPPLFPIGLAALPGSIEFHDVEDSTFDIGSVRVTARRIPHVGPTNGYRLEWNGHSVAYLSDHQQPSDGSFAASHGALELCRDVDVLIHDAQYTADEFAAKSTWGHCMVDYAVWLAGHSGAKRLVLFHHDPSRDDEQIDELAAAAAVCGEAKGLDVVAAREGATIVIG
jgi:phosphoribosyl 1,2-cyclic phosphodiesterase